MGRVKFIPKEQKGWADLLDEFVMWKLVEGVSDQTASDYYSHVKLFMKRFPDSWDSEENLKLNLLEHLSQKMRPATFNNRLIYIRTFLSWCVENEYLKDNPISKLKKRKDEGRIIDIELSSLKKLLEQPDTNTFAGLRDYALILLTLDNGIRPKEAMSLIPKDFREKSLEIIIRPEVAKTRKIRRLPISEITARAIKRLISVRHDDWGNDVPIFCSYEGKHLTRHTWGDRLEVYSKRIGVHVTPYALRHCFALEFIRNGASAFHLQKALGHTTMAVTRRYVSLVDEDLRVQHTKASPLNNLVPSVRKIKI
ncbi:site-specific integrase [Paenibacillus sp. FSL K6-4396]|uniref:tyrosine-type recombinase/integrase n=1 Tax=Paenibacillus sp. FSL K6-4396 TaxID=2921506 RepID=UPI0030F5F325